MMNFNIFFTNRCNLKCSYCYEGCKQSKDISIDILNSTLEFMKKVASNKTDISVTTHGGEPLLAFDKIQYFIKKAEEIFPEIRFNMTTNATLLTADRIDFIKKHYNQISVSIDGNRLAHNTNRIFLNGSGSYDVVTDNIKKLFDQGMKIQARMTVNPRNYMYVSEGVQHLINMGFTEILPLPDVFSKEWSNDMLSGLACQMKKIIRYLNENKDNAGISVGFIDTVKCKMKNTYCNGGISTYTINTDGKIYPCILCNADENYCIGTVEEGVDNEKLKYIHRNDKQCIEQCIGCTRYDYCINTRCKLINELIEGNANSPIPVQCQLENIVVELDEYADTFS